MQNKILTLANSSVKDLPYIVCAKYLINISIQKSTVIFNKVSPIQ